QDAVLCVGDELSGLVEIERLVHRREPERGALVAGRVARRRVGMRQRLSLPRAPWSWSISSCCFSGRATMRQISTPSEDRRSFEKLRA
ncbi:MAG: hypothetical protein WA624_12635, partial [Methylocella sp.]